MHATIPLILNIVLLTLFFKKRSPFFAFYGALLLVFSIPHLYHSVSQSLDFPNSVYWTTTIHAVVFFSTTLLTTLAVWRGRFPSRIFDPLNVDKKTLTRTYYLSLLFWVIFLFLILAAVDFHLMELIYSSWNDFRSSESRLKLIGLFFSFPGAAFVLVAIKKRSTGLAQVVVILLLGFIILGLKIRSPVVILFVPVLIHTILFRSWNFRRIVLFVILLSLFFSAYSLTRSVRHTNVTGFTEAAEAGDVELDRGEFELIESFYYIVKKNGLSNDIEFPNFVRLLLLPIPSSIIPFNKPTETSLVLWNEKTGIINVFGSLHPTAVGDAVANSYYFGAFVYGLLYTLIFHLLDSVYVKLRASRIFIFSILTVVSFYWARGAFYNGVIYLISSVLIIWLSMIVLKITGKRMYND